MQFDNNFRHGFDHKFCFIHIISWYSSWKHVECDPDLQIFWWWNVYVIVDSHEIELVQDTVTYIANNNRYRVFKFWSQDFVDFLYCNFLVQFLMNLDCCCWVKSNQIILNVRTLRIFSQSWAKNDLLYYFISLFRSKPAKVDLLAVMGRFGNKVAA